MRWIATVVAVLLSIPLVLSGLFYGAVLVSAVHSPHNLGEAGNAGLLALGVSLLWLFVVATCVLAVSWSMRRRIARAWWMVALAVLLGMTLFAIRDYLHAAAGFALVGPFSVPAFVALAWLLMVSRPHPIE